MSLTQKIFDKKVINFLGLSLFLFNGFGYVLSATIPLALNVNSTPINTAFRGVYLGVSLILIASYTIKKKKPILHVGGIAIICFWVVYSIRLIYDLSFRGISFADKGAFFTYQFAFGASFLPALAIILVAKNLHVSIFFKHTVYYFLTLCNALILGFLINERGFSIRLFLERTSLMSNVNGEVVHVINPITYGFYGCVLVVMSLYMSLILNPKSKQNFIEKILPIVTLILGILNLVLGASRGPIASCVIVSSIICFFYLKNVTYTLTFISKFLAILFIIIFSYFSYLAPFLATNNDLESLNRVTNTLDNRAAGGKEDRNDLWNEAWEQFLDSPIWGDQYVLRFEKFYPHNLFLEVLMATGVIGGCLFTFILIYILKYSYQAFQDTNVFFLFILFFPRFIASFTSGSLFIDPEFWMLSTFFLVITPQIYTKQKLLSSLIVTNHEK